MTNDQRLGNVVGRIRRRLLVNQWVDPTEVQSLLPTGVRPRLGSTGGVIVGCCMLELASTRPWPAPAALGIGIRAAAHRISVEVGPEDEPTMAVWVPARHTDSRPGVVAGGRIFPGVHFLADVTVEEDSQTLRWSVKGRSNPLGSFDIEATARLDGGDDTPCEVADIVIGTRLGLSPGHKAGQVEAVEMNPAHFRSAVVQLNNLESDFMSSFASAEPAETLLMSNVDVTWQSVATP